MKINTEQFKLMKALMIHVGEEDSLISFEEAMQSIEVQKTVRLWEQDDVLFAFAYIDDYFNLRYAIDPEYATAALEDEIVDWGVHCVQERNLHSKEKRTLDLSCEAADIRKIDLSRRHGFIMEEIRTLDYSRSLLTPIPFFHVPEKFTIRPVLGESEVDALVTLHRAAFGTNGMTREQRLAIMRTAQYIPELDLVVEHETHRLAAFCIFEIDSSSDGRRIGYPDPIGTHPDFQRHKLASALLSFGMQKLKEIGAVEAQSGTSNKNKPMQQLFVKMGFQKTKEQIWFSKIVN